MTSDQEDLQRYVSEELRALVRLFSQSRATELEVTSGDLQISVKRGRTPTSETGVQLGGEASIIQSESLLPGVAVISSPMVGRFFHSEQPGRAPLIEPGSRVEPGALIGVIEALEVLTEVEADGRGVVQKMLVGDGDAVEYGQPLVEVLLDV